MMLYRSKKLLFSLMVINMSACSSTQLIPFSVIKESNQCQSSDVKLSLLTDEKEQDHFINSFSLFKSPETTQELTQLFNQHNKAEDLFVVSLGRQTSAGYGFNILDTKGSLLNNTLTLPIEFTSPEASTMRAQVITSPCLVVGIDSKAQYDRLIIDHLELSISK